MLQSLNFQEAQRINYDPKRIISIKKKRNKCGTCEHQEVPYLTTLANTKVVNMDYIIEESSRTSKSQGALNPQEPNIQTPMKKDKGNKISQDEVVGMEVDTTASSKRIKESTEDQKIVILDLDESTNQEEIGKGVTIQQENPEQEATSSSEQIVSQFVVKTHQSSIFLDLQSYQYEEAFEAQYKSKLDLIQQYTKKMDINLQENQKRIKDVRKDTPNKVSMLTIKEPTQNVLNIALVEDDKVVEIKLRMDKISVPDKIHFHRQTSEVLYHDLLQSILSNKKLESEVTKLEQQLKKERAMGKSQKTQYKKLELDLMKVGLKPDSKKIVKNLLEEKDKVITSLKKKLKIPMGDHPQTKELHYLHKEVDSLQQTTLDLKAKVLQLKKEKKCLQKEKQESILPTTTTEQPQQNPIDELIQAMSQVSLKDGEVKELKGKTSKLQQENKNLQKDKKDLENKVFKQKEKLKGKLQLQGAKHMIWDQILIEVTKMWELLNVVEDRIVLVRNDLVKHETSNELMQRRPAEKAQKTVNFLSNISNQHLITLKVQDRLGIVRRAKNFRGMHNLMNQVKMAAEEMKEDVKQFQLQFKDVIDKGLPSFWDKDNRLLHKNDYDKLLSQGRMNHDKFQDMEKGLKAQQIMSKL